MFKTSKLTCAVEFLVASLKNKQTKKKTTSVSKPDDRDGTTLLDLRFKLGRKRI